MLPMLQTARERLLALSKAERDRLYKELLARTAFLAVKRNGFFKRY